MIIPAAKLPKYFIINSALRLFFYQVSIFLSTLILATVAKISHFGPYFVNLILGQGSPWIVAYLVSASMLGRSIESKYPNLVDRKEIFIITFWNFIINIVAQCLIALVTMSAAQLKLINFSVIFIALTLLVIASASNAFIILRTINLTRNRRSKNKLLK